MHAMEFLTLSVTVAAAAFSILFFFLLLTKRHAGVGGTRYVSCSHACQFYFCVGYEYKHKVALLVVAAVPGLPVIGNLLQLKEKKPYKTFTQMAHKHGPIYSIRTGASTLIVLNSPHLAKEVTPYSFQLNLHHNTHLAISLLSYSYIAYYIGSGHGDQIFINLNKEAIKCTQDSHF